MGTALLQTYLDGGQTGPKEERARKNSAAYSESRTKAPRPELRQHQIQTGGVPERACGPYLCGCDYGRDRMGNVREMLENRCEGNGTPARHASTTFTTSTRKFLQSIGRSRKRTPCLAPAQRSRWFGTCPDGRPAQHRINWITNRRLTAWPGSPPKTGIVRFDGGTPTCTRPATKTATAAAGGEVHYMGSVPGVPGMWGIMAALPLRCPRNRVYAVTEKSDGRVYTPEPLRTPLACYTASTLQSGVYLADFAGEVPTEKKATGRRKPIFRHTPPAGTTPVRMSSGSATRQRLVAGESVRRQHIVITLRILRLDGACPPESAFARIACGSAATTTASTRFHRTAVR
ncbi:hypothetical protein FQR65_LT20734 [Abscondita terminalis]|nr:hypothetical protein FQR65_LT20734 [Abscondita terminalis]